MTHRTWFHWLLGLFLLWALALGIAPLYRHDWLLENVLSLAAVILLLSTSKSFTLSRLSYTLIFMFLCLHELGTHYTYAEVPYDQWWQSAFGYSLNGALGFERIISTGWCIFCMACCWRIRCGKCLFGWRM